MMHTYKKVHLTDFDHVMYESLEKVFKMVIEIIHSCRCEKKFFQESFILEGE